MNILLITNLFPTPIDPERGIFTLQLAKRLGQHAQVTVVCPLPWFPSLRIFKSLRKWYSFSQVPFQYQLDGIQVYSPKYAMVPKISEANHAKLIGLSLSRFIRKICSKQSFDVINSHWLYPDSVAVDKAIDGCNIAHVCTGLGCDVNHDLFARAKRKAMRQMLNNASEIIVVSNDLKRVLIGDGIAEEKITAIPNGVDLNRFNAIDKNTARQSLNLCLNSRYILYVGRLSSEKNISSLIEAFGLLSDKSIKLVIVGDGPEKASLNNIVNKLTLAERVLFIGKVEHKNISTWMSACDYFSLPSYREGCPNVVLEALGCGIPVIASKVGGIPDLVSKDSGILFDPTDIPSITKALEQAMLKDWSRATITDSVNNLSWEKASEKYISVFNRAITNQEQLHFDH